MEPWGRARHRWEKPRGRMGGSTWVNAGNERVSNQERAECSRGIVGTRVDSRSPARSVASPCDPCSLSTGVHARRILEKFRKAAAQQHRRARETAWAIQSAVIQRSYTCTNNRTCRNCMCHRCSSGNFCRSSCKQVDLPQIQPRKSSLWESKTEF